MKKNWKPEKKLVLIDGNLVLGYKNPKTFTYYSKRYDKYLTVEQGFTSDGASGPAIDINSQSWWVHDKICRKAEWDDGTPITNWQASTVLSDILWKEKRWFRAFYWWPATYLFGCKDARKNGWF